MSPRDSKIDTVGFLTIVDDAQLGFMGGYLILNAQARPLEFHCTAPVQPTRAQEILYGVTLREYLFGELISRALVTQGKHKPRCVLSDLSEAAATSSVCDTPLFWLVQDHGNRLDKGIWSSLELGSYALAARDSEQIAWVDSAEAAWIRDMDLEEPFHRIRDAIDEAQRPSRAA